MGLFSTLTSSDDGPQTSSVDLPTVVQLYTNKPILLDSTSKVTGYTAMTYQAIQVGSFSEEQDVKNRHQNPDLGVWNCQVGKETLLDSLLAKVTSHLRTYCWTVDLSDSTAVEPTISLLQGALVRYLSENPPPDDQQRQTSTTSLYQLQYTQFGLAVDDKESNISEKNIVNESAEKVKTSVMICVILPVEQEEVSESAYKTNQANALVIYHLRKFAAAINAPLCFVQPEQHQATKNSAETASSPVKDSQQQQQQRQSASLSSQPAVSFDELSKLWRELALDKLIWETDDKENTNGNGNEEETPIVVATPLYGPGRHQEDFIESVLLRNAHYPGHWEANKDSLWVALPTASEAPAAKTGPNSGDGNWLTQLRESIVSAADAQKLAVAPEETKKEEETKENQDVAVSDFFASLLKE
jgi:hypothetical protein